MFNRKSSYALNKKDPNAIVYMDIPPFHQFGVGERSSGAAGSAAILRQIIPSRI